MSKSNKSTTPAVNLTGLTAKQMREMLDAKQIAPATVIAFLKAKETERGSLRYPARTLLAELTGEKPAASAAPAKPAEKPAASVAPAKTAAKPAAEKPAPAKPEPVAPTLDIAGRLDRLEAAVAALVKALTPAPAAVSPATPATPAKARGGSRRKAV